MDKKTQGLLILFAVGREDVEQQDNVTAGLGQHKLKDKEGKSKGM